MISGENQRRKQLLAFDPIKLATTMLTCGWFNFSLHGRPGDNITGLFHLD